MLGVLAEGYKVLANISVSNIFEALAKDALSLSRGPRLVVVLENGL